MLRMPVYIMLLEACQSVLECSWYLPTDTASNGGYTHPKALLHAYITAGSTNV